MIHLLFEVVFFSPTAAWGWFSLILLAVVISLPYFRRGTPAQTAASRERSTRPYLKGLWAHYWLGPVVAGGSLIHAWIPMAAGHMPQTSMNGLWLATYALGFLFLQVLLGIALRYASAGAAQIIRRVHFVVMLAIVALVLAHLWLNGPWPVSIL